MVYIYKLKEDGDVIMVLFICSLFIVDQRIERVIVFIWYELLREDRLNLIFQRVVKNDIVLFNGRYIVYIKLQTIFFSIIYFCFCRCQSVNQCS